jgi:hypothetical protein
MGHVYSAATGLAVAGAWVEAGDAVTSTDALGYYALEGLSSGWRSVRVSAAGFEDYSAGVEIDGATTHDIYMTVTIKVTDVSGVVDHVADGPLEGARVELGGYETLTDTSGHYELRNIPEGTQAFVVEKSGYRGASGTIHVHGDEQELDFTLKKYASVTLPCFADAGVREHMPFDTFGADTTLILFYNTSFHHKFYVFFPMDLPPSAVAEEAQLRLFNTWTGGGGEGRPVLVGHVLEGWDEMAVTWNDSLQTGVSSEAQSSYVQPWFEIDVTTYVHDWLTGVEDNNGVQIDTEEGDSYGFFAFASREHPTEDRRPRLILDYAW